MNELCHECLSKEFLQNRNFEGPHSNLGFLGNHVRKDIQERVNFPVTTHHDVKNHNEYEK